MQTLKKVEPEKLVSLIEKCRKVAYRANQMANQWVDPETVIDTLCEKLKMTESEVSFAIMFGTKWL